MKLFSLRQRVGPDLCKDCFNWMKNFPFNVPRMLTLEEKKLFLSWNSFEKQGEWQIYFKFLSQPCMFKVDLLVF